MGNVRCCHCGYAARAHRVGRVKKNWQKRQTQRATKFVQIGAVKCIVKHASGNILKRGLVWNRVTVLGRSESALQFTPYWVLRDVRVVIVRLVSSCFRLQKPRPGLGCLSWPNSLAEWKTVKSSTRSVWQSPQLALLGILQSTIYSARIGSEFASLAVCMCAHTQRPWLLSKRWTQVSISKRSFVTFMILVAMRTREKVDVRSAGTCVVRATLSSLRRFSRRRSYRIHPHIDFHLFAVTFPLSI